MPPPPTHDSGITDSPTLGREPVAAGNHVRKKPVNFSRRSAPTAAYRDDQQQHDVRAIQAYYEPESVLPSPTASAYPSQELAWDGQRGEMVSRRKAPQRVEDQRHPGPRSRTSSSSSSNTSDDDDDDDDTILQLGSAESVKPLIPIKSILKKTEVEQYSEHASSEAGESTRSRHAVSENGSGTWDTQGNWHASNASTSCLSEKEVKKLEKKGIDPSLYVEMKQAKGKSVVGVLTGNSFVG